ncbi:MAG: hypothetical protein HKL90_08935 [Elusimicrobia bacterium]|nr:hypothetical protein [Elusimicrobiota bacterium]
MNRRIAVTCLAALIAASLTIRRASAQTQPDIKAMFDDAINVVRMSSAKARKEATMAGAASKFPAKKGSIMLVSNGGSCGGSSDMCDYVGADGKDACNSQSGCNWSRADRDCEGIEDSCSDMTNSSDCENLRGCNWQDGSGSDGSGSSFNGRIF